MPKYHSSTPRGDQHGVPAAESKDAPLGGLAAGSIIHRLRSLLGDDVVLLPCGRGEKGSRWEKWQDITIGKMRDEPYLRALGRAHNIAVLLGKASGGLCTIDIDGDETIEPFLLLNPKLATTLRSRGKRGCNLWVRIKGDFPRPAMIKRQDGSAWGEWRADRFCTMIHGIHPDGMRYERSPEVPPVEIGFEEIVWPGDLVLPWKLDRTKNESPRQADGGRKWTAGEIGEMLSCIPARPDYDQWLRVSSAVWSVLGEDEGTVVLRAWSPEEQPGEYDEKFKHRLERVTAGTLVHIARQHGWRGRTPVRSDGVPAMTTEEAIGKFYYDGSGKYHLDTGVLLVPMDQRSVIRHLKLWGFADTPASDGAPGIELINPMLCEIQTRRYVKKADEINRFGPDDLLARAYELAFDENTPPPPDELCMNLGEYPIAARGNLTCVQGKSKVGKSAVIAAILGACQRGQYACTGDTLHFEWEGSDGGAIIHLDTEQSSGDWHALVRRSVRRSGLPSVSDRLLSIPLVRFARSERVTILELVLDRERKEHGTIDAVVIDGVADLCASPNDEAESLELISRLHALAQEYSTPIFCVLHENPFGDPRSHQADDRRPRALSLLRRRPTRSLAEGRHDRSHPRPGPLHPQCRNPSAENRSDHGSRRRDPRRHAVCRRPQGGHGSGGRRLDHRPGHAHVPAGRGSGRGRACNRLLMRREFAGRSFTLGGPRSRNQVPPCLAGQ